MAMTASAFIDISAQLWKNPVAASGTGQRKQLELDLSIVEHSSDTCGGFAPFSLAAFAPV
ncbi:MAG: hypothetical protein QOC96_3601 [Acidobacteriota bacterium]|jgi:hypothetical protein|nr:hypothetical protein [Acidobacteriota bacterium]